MYPGPGSGGVMPGVETPLEHVEYAPGDTQ